MAHYNSKKYNDTAYNITTTLKSLVDSLSLSDDISKQVLQLLSDSTTTSDTITDDLYKLLEDYILHADVESVLFLTDKLEVMNLTEDLQIAFQKSLVESLTLAESFNTTWFAERLFQDIIFLDESFSKQVTNKGLFDSIRLNDWLSVKLSPANQWSD